MRAEPSARAAMNTHALSRRRACWIPARPWDKLLAHGFAIFPVRLRGKEPLTEHGLKDATRDLAKIEMWARQWPGCNWGVALGGASACFVLDFDTPDGTEIFERTHGKLPPTYTVKTARGSHLYFRLRESGVLTRRFEGGEVRSDGAYVVGEGSIHPSGAAYQCLSDVAIAEFPCGVLEHLAPRPVPEVRPEAAIPEGQRNAALTSYAGTMRRRGMGREAIAAALHAENTARCSPPLPEDEVERIAASVARYTPSEAGSDRQQETKTVSIGAVLCRVCDIPAQKLRWLWPGRIPLGKLTLFAGDPGLGKSLVTLDMAARVTCGSEWPDGVASSGQPGSVIVLSAEDDAADTIRPRLEAAGADLSKVHILQAVRHAKPNGGISLEHFSLETDLVALQDAVAALGDVSFIVLDPVSAYLGDTDSHVNARVRGLLAPLAGLACGLGVAVVAVDHLSKSNRPALYRPNGSIAFVAAARAVWLFARNPDDPAQRLMLPGKQNLGPDQAGLSYTVAEAKPGIAAVTWGGTVSLSADAVLQPEADGERSERLEAMDWLREHLSAGPVSAKQIQTDAKRAGFSWSTVRRGKDALGIIPSKNGFEGGWSWRLPPAEDAHETSKALTSKTWASSENLSTFGTDGASETGNSGPKFLEGEL